MPVSMLLDIVEVACSHSSNLAAAFASILDYFGIREKVLKKNSIC